MLRHTATVEGALARHKRIDILDNNVGIAEHGGVLEVSIEAWDRTFAVNVVVIELVTTVTPTAITLRFTLP